MQVDIYGSFAELQANNPEKYFHYFVAMNIVLEHRTFFLEKRNKTIVFGHWRAKELNERFAGKWEEIDGDIYVDKERRLIGLDTTTALSYKVGGVVIED